MRKIVKQVVGIDVAQKELVVSVGRMYDDLFYEVFASGKFPNTKKGFQALLSWIARICQKGVAVRYVMEATGIYHEALAYFLDGKNMEVSIVLPNKISNYFRTLEIKTITDKSCAEAITMFGLERKLQVWKRPKKVFKTMKQLTRERDQLKCEKTVILNQMHAEKAEADTSDDSLSRMQKRIALINKQIKEIESDLSRVVKSDAEVTRSVAVMTSVTGIAELTAATMLAETNGYDLIRNKRQLSSYAGFDVKEKQSGTSVKGKSKISKRGNRYLRKAMYMPAMTAIRHDERFKAIYARLIAKHGIKMKALVAIQRKLLELAYTLHKNNEKYDKQYLQKQIAAELEQDIKI